MFKKFSSLFFVVSFLFVTFFSQTVFALNPPKIIDLRLESDVFYPRSGEKATIYFNVGGECSWECFLTVKITDTAGKSKYLFPSYDASAAATGHEIIIWNGKDANGNFFADGKWNVHVSITNGAGSDSADKEFEIKTDATADISKVNTSDAPSIYNFFTYPEIFSVEAKTTELSFTLSQPGYVDLSISDSTGKKVKSYSDYNGTKLYQSSDYPLSFLTEHSVTWDGKDDSGKMLPYGDYTVRVYAKSDAGSHLMTKTVTIGNDALIEVKDLFADPTNFSSADGKTTNITFGLEEAAYLDVSVWSFETGDSIEVKNFAGYDGSKLYQPANFSLTWDGKDDSGNYVAQGTYSVLVISKASSGGEGGMKDVLVTVSSSAENTSGEACSGFTDVAPSSKYCEAITWAKQEGIFVGYKDGTFKVFQPISRVEALKVILEGLGVNILSDDGSTLGFSDVKAGDWYMKYIKTGKSLGIFTGDAGKNTARPHDTVNYVESYKLIFETLKIAKQYAIDTTPTCSVKYQGGAEGEWYYPYVCEAQTNNLVDGSADFLPSVLSTRGEIAVMLYTLHKGGVL
ncbi:MAG: FlgD immunoglobulin-like domain containing protein [Candidatus Gracilibacteria bacterium]|jgi:flagellar hook assembly protein FlgD